MEKTYTLSSLREGEQCRVKALAIDGKMRSRLSDLGLIEGTKVACVQKSSENRDFSHRSVKLYRTAFSIRDS